MTLLEAKARLFGHFTKNAIFNIEEDFNNVFLPIGDVDVIKQICIKALSEIEESRVVLKIQDGAWVLRQPLTNYSQNIEIDGATGLTIATMINRYCEECDDEASIANPLAIEQKDILNLLKIISFLNDEEPEIDDQGMIDDDD